MTSTYQTKSVFTSRISPVDHEQDLLYFHHGLSRWNGIIPRLPVFIVNTKPRLERQKQKLDEKDTIHVAHEVSHLLK